MSARRPRIALVTDAVFPYHRGGKEIRYHEVAQRLTVDADIDVYTMRWWKHDGEVRSDNVTYKAIAPLLPLYTATRRSIRQAVVFALCTLKLVFHRFDALEADHMPYIQLLPLWLVTRVRRKRFVVTWHEVWGADAWHAYLGPLGSVAWAIERLAMRLPDEIVAASEETAERLRAYVRPGLPITVAPNGIDLPLVRSTMPAPERFDIVAVGRFLPHKRFDLVLETVARLNREGVPATCLIIGDGPGREALLSLATDLRVADQVTFRHDVAEQRELYSLLKSSRIFLAPSEREGFGIAVLEAIACGLDVVTTSAPDNLSRILVERSGAGSVCEPTLPAIVEAVQRQLGLPLSLDEPAADHTWIEAYDWDPIAARVREACMR